MKAGQTSDNHIYSSPFLVTRPSNVFRPQQKATNLCALYSLLRPQKNISAEILKAQGKSQMANKVQ